MRPVGASGESATNHSLTRPGTDGRLRRRLACRQSAPQPSRTAGINARMILLLRAASRSPTAP
jgi:hypothetical protein